MTTPQSSEFLTTGLPVKEVRIDSNHPNLDAILSWVVAANHGVGEVPDLRMVVLRGVPGSGKSTLARHIVDLAESGPREAVIASADDYFVGEDGVYRFDKTKLGAAHGRCRDVARSGLSYGQVVVVDNTNVRLRDVREYADLLVEAAEKQGKRAVLLVIAVVPENLGHTEPGVTDPAFFEALRQQEDAYLAMCAARNTHGVPADRINSMWENLQATLHLHRFGNSSQTPSFRAAYQRLLPLDF